MQFKIFFPISSLCTCTLKWLGRNREQISFNMSSAYHMQHVVPRGTKDSLAIKFDRVEIAFIWALIYLLNP